MKNNIYKWFLCVAVSSLCLPIFAQGNLARVLPEALEKSSEALLEQSLRASLQRSGQLALEKSLFSAVRVPAQMPALVPQPLKEVEAQLASGTYSSTLISSLVAHVPTQKNDKLLYRDFFNLSLQGGRPVAADKKTLLDLFEKNAHTHLYQVTSEEFLAKNKGLYGENLVKLAADIAGLGLYGSSEQASALRALYKEGENTKIQPLLLLWTTRSLLVLEGESNALAFVKAAPQSGVRERLLEFFFQDKNTPAPTELKPNKAFENLRPLVERISPQMVFEFDFSPTATAYFVTWRNHLDKSAVAGVTEHSRVGKWHTKLNRMFHRAYPSGLLEEERLISDWLEYYNNGYFKPRNQIEVIEGMSPAKANNIMEYLYYMSMEEAEQIILSPLRQTGKLPAFMYTDELIKPTFRLPFAYYKNKFNQNIARFVELADKEGTIYTDNVELKDLVTSMKDYTFEQGFLYPNSAELTSGLKKNWNELVTHITQRGLRADRHVVNELWRRPVALPDGQQISLRDYFTQTRRSFASNRDVAPSFYLNSPKWVAWENERRNLKAKEWFPQEKGQQDSMAERLRKKIALGNPDDYLTLEQFGEVMRALYLSAYGKELGVEQPALSESPLISGFRDEKPSSTTIKINNFDKSFGMCIAPMNEQYVGNVKSGYDGTSTVARFEPVVFDNVPVVLFDPKTLEVSVQTLDKVSYLKDLKQPDIDKVRASTMVSDGLDFSRDLLTVERAEQALPKVSTLRATIYPQSRLSYADKIPYMTGGGLAGYLALFTKDFYPIKTVKRLKKVDGKYVWVPEYYVRKEVAALAGMIARERLAFTTQVADRIVK